MTRCGLGSLLLTSLILLVGCHVQGKRSAEKSGPVSRDPAEVSPSDTSRELVSVSGQEDEDERLRDVLLTGKGIEDVPNETWRRLWDGAVQTMMHHTDTSDLGNLIPPERWEPEIERLRPIRVCIEHCNIVAVLAETPVSEPNSENVSSYAGPAYVEEGVYFCMPISSYAAGPDDFEMYERVYDGMADPESLGPREVFRYRRRRKGSPSQLE